MLERIHHALYLATREREGQWKRARPRRLSTAKAPKPLKRGSALDPQTQPIAPES